MYLELKNQDTSRCPGQPRKIFFWSGKAGDRGLVVDWWEECGRGLADYWANGRTGRSAGKYGQTVCQCLSGLLSNPHGGASQKISHGESWHSAWDF